VTKPRKIAAGIAVGGVCCAALAAATTGPARVWWAWTAASCVVATAAYLANRPRWLGKRDGRLGLRALPVLPYLAAFGIAVAIMRWWRGPDAPARVAPGLWVGGRLSRATCPHGVTHVVDLVAEYPAPRWARRLPGYRNLPLLDGSHPPRIGEFLALVRELRDVRSDVLVHCDSGRGRAPTLAAALVIARGLAPDVDRAVALVRAGRPAAAPTRSDLAFLREALPGLRELARPRVLPRPRPAADDPRRSDSRAR
jgi:hypothetical protein